MEAASQEIPRGTWREYFDEYSKTMLTSEVTVEVTGQDVGDQIAAERLVLTGITYDDKDDILVVGVDAPGGDPEEYEHIIQSPQQIYFAPLEGGAATFDVADADGHQHLIHIRPVVPLPPG